MVGFRSGAELAGAARARFDPHVELALLRVFGLDVLDPQVSLRRVALAVRGLPMGSWPDPDHAASWSITDHLLATLIDEVRQLTWITASVNSKHKVKRPAPIDRPGGGMKPKRKGTWADFARRLNEAPGA